MIGVGRESLMYEGVVDGFCLLLDVVFDVIIPGLVGSRLELSAGTKNGVIREEIREEFDAGETALDAVTRGLEFADIDKFDLGVKDGLMLLLRTTDEDTPTPLKD